MDTAFITCTDDYGNLTGYVLYESVDQAQRAEATFSGEESMFKVSPNQTTPINFSCSLQCVCLRVQYRKRQFTFVLGPYFYCLMILWICNSMANNIHQTTH